MSDADIPSRFAPAFKWVCASIFLAVFALGASDTLRARDDTVATIYAALFVATFIVAVKWTTIAPAWSRMRARGSMFFIALGLCGALALGIALGGLLNRGGSLNFPLQAAGRIVWNFDQPSEYLSLAMSRYNDQELRVAGFRRMARTCPRSQSQSSMASYTAPMKSDRFIF
jgi:hypothetical protein